MFLVPSTFAARKTPTFEVDILPILEANCFSCHGTASPQANLDLRSLSSILKGGKSGPAIVVGSAGKSLLMEKVASKTMPPTEEKLTDEEIETIRAWIKKGAQRDSGTRKHVAATTKQSDDSPITEHDVLPIFQIRCIACHGKRKQEAGVDLRTRASRLKEGPSGPLLVPGKPGESGIIERIVSRECPPNELQLKYSVRPPTTSELDQLRRWIAAGAPAGPLRRADLPPDDDPLVTDKDRNFWSFKPPTHPALPKIRQQHLVRNPIDSFLLEKLEAKDLTFSAQGETLKLLRRAYLDLIGMPPSAAEVEGYLEDKRPDAYERMIDRLLASPITGKGGGDTGWIWQAIPIPKALATTTTSDTMPGATEITWFDPSTVTNPTRCS